MAELTGRTLGDYILREKIGGGGYGDVYRVEHRLLKRVAVVKVLKEKLQLRHDAKVQFLREAQLASQLRHPYAAHVYDFGVSNEDGLLWIAMEFVEGVTLAEWLEKHGPMSLEEFVPFFEYMAEAVHAAHTAGIVHRDLKPSNVMVMKRQGLLVPKLLDFGIAKGKVAPLEDEEPIDASGGDKAVMALIQATARITPTGPAVGSRPYMSPEQRGNASGVVPEGDIYSLGIIIYETLSGRLPFPAVSTDDFFRYHYHSSVPVLGCGLSPDLDRVLSRALDKVPSHRHGNVLELAADLRAVLQADPREQIRSLTRRWHEGKRSPDLLARGQVLKGIERYVHRVGEQALSDLECSFVVNSQRLARRIRWFLGSLVALAALVVAGFAAMQLRSARQLAEVTVRQSELEQGRSALLHGEPEALPHLAEAYKHGERSPSTKFMFDTSTWAQVCSIPRVRRLAFDPTGAHLVTGSIDGDASIWEIPSGTRIRRLRELGEAIDAVAVSPDGQLVVAASRDGAVQVWHVGSGELQSQFNPRHSRILAVEFDRTSKLTLAAGTDGTVVVADAALGMPVTVLEGPQNDVRVAHFDPDSRHVVGASRDGTARVWDATAPYRRWSLPPTSDDCGLVSSPEPDGRVVAVRCGDHVTRVWDTARDQLIAELPSVSHVEGDFTSAFAVASPAGDRAAIARGNGVEVYELPGGRLLRTIAQGAPVNVVAFATTGRDLVSGAVDGSLLVARDNGALLALPTSPGGIDAAAFLPDGRVVASDAQQRLRVYDRLGAVLADLELPGRVMSLRLNGSLLVTVPICPGSAAPPVLLDLKSYRIIAQLVGHVGQVLSVRWVADDRILTAGGDGTARLWDGATGQLRQVYRGSSRFLADATLAPGGFVVAGGADGLLRFWDPASGQLLWTLQVDKSPLVALHVDGDDIVTRGFSGELSRWTLPRSEQVIKAWEDHERRAIVQP